MQNTQQTITIVTRKATSQSSSGYHYFTLLTMSVVMMNCSFVNAVKTPVNQPALVICIVNEQHKVVTKIDTGMYLI